MIKFLKKTRRYLLSEGKTGEYFKYAIGEIVLVVIGILIALQINNLNEIRKNKKLEIQYLKGIRTNIKQDFQELEKHFENDTLKLDAITYINRIINSGKLKSTSLEEFGYNWNHAFSTHWFEGQNVVFDDMKSSGKINLIQSDTLKIEIQKYYRFFEEVIKEEEFHNNLSQKYEKELTNNINLGPLYEDRFIKRWNGNISIPKYSIILNTITKKMENSIIENNTQRKLLLIKNHYVRSVLLEKNSTLLNHIDSYLNSLK